MKRRLNINGSTVGRANYDCAQLGYRHAEGVRDVLYLHEEIAYLHSDHRAEVLMFERAEIETGSD